jgi:flagellar biosynthesis anti-sigma factor FlgM
MWSNAMKITNNGLNPINTPKTETSSTVGKTGQGSETAPIEKRDRAELSEQARIMLKSKNRLGELDAAQNERIEELRKSIETGNYQVPVEKLASILTARLKNF